MKKIIVGVNDLATTNPQLSSEWHPTKNPTLKPTDVMEGGRQKVWWLVPYDDPITGKHFDFEWEATIASRNAGSGCPFFSGRVWEGYNDLSTTNPELASEWHPTRNGALKPEHVTAGSKKKVWWLVPFDDPITGKHFDFEWEATVVDRSRCGCPFLSPTNPKVWKGYNDLATCNPDLAKQWHPTKNGMLTPADVTLGSDKMVWWLYEYTDPITQLKFDFEWQTTIKDRGIRGYGCPFLSPNPKVWRGFNDLATTNPILAKQWHPTRNRDLRPDDVTAGSNRYAWWRCSKGHEWRAIINSRNMGRGCPKCSEEGNTSFPEQAVFYYVKKVFPNAINRFSEFGFEIDVYIPHYNVGIEYDGQFFHDEPERDKAKDDIAAEKGIKLIRIREPKCPVYASTAYRIERLSLSDKGLEQAIEHTIHVLSQLTGVKVETDIDILRDYQEINDLTEKTERENSLSVCYPDLALEWHPTKNGKQLPTNILPGSTKKIWWKCRVCNYEWVSTPNSRTNGSNKRGCPVCGRKKQLLSFNDAMINNKGSLQANNPLLAIEWNYKRNGDLSPESVTAHSKKQVWWKCSKDHEWRASVDSRNRSKGTGCPYCTNKKVSIGENDLLTCNPELAQEWNYEKNKGLRNGNGTLIEAPQYVTCGSSQSVWWKCTNGHEWQATIKSRSSGKGCPICSKKK